MVSIFPILFLCLPVLYFAPMALIVWTVHLYFAASRRDQRFRRLGRAYGPIAFTHLVAAITGGSLLLDSIGLSLDIADTLRFWGLQGLFVLTPAAALATIVWPPQPTTDPIPGLDSYYAASILVIACCFVPSGFMAFLIASL